MRALAALVVLLFAVLLLVTGPESPRSPARGPGVAPPPVPAAAEPTAVLDRREVLPDGGAPPIPADAVWLDVAVVDEATGEPVADADVRWDDASLWEWIDLRQASRDDERRQRCCGWHTRSDARGVARVFVDRSTIVTGRCGDRYGVLECDTGAVAPPDGYHLLLQRDRSLSVQVIDADGLPAAGAGVALVFDDEGRSSPSGEPMAISSVDGMVHLTHLQRWTWTPEEGETWRVRLVRPLSSGWVTFDIDDPPAEPIVLQLPPCGSMAVRLERAGKPLRGDPLRLLGDAEQADWEQVTDADGWARFTQLPLGREYLLEALTTDVAATVRGPTRAGECVEVVVAAPLREFAALVTGRAVDVHGVPLRRRTLTLLATKAARSDEEVDTDADGRFRCEYAEIPERDATLQLRAPSPLAACLPIAGLCGERDLGDVVLAPLPLLVSGRLVSGGRPWPDSWAMDVEWCEAALADTARAEQGWRPVPGAVSIDCSDGAFAVHGHAPAGSFRVGLRRWDRLQAPMVPFRPGDRDVLVEVTERVPLRATLLLPEGMSWSSLDRYGPLRLVPEPPTSGPADHDGDRWFDLGAQIEGRPGDRCDAKWRSLPPGTYRLEFRLPTVPQPLVLVEHVVVPTPPGGDPRLCDIDLRQRMEVLQLRFVDAAGEPLDRELRDQYGQTCRGIAIPEPAAASPPVAVQFACDVARLTLPPGPHDLRIAVEGFRPTLVRGVRGTATVALTPWREAELVVDPMPELPAGFELLARLQPQQGSPGAEVADQNGHPAAHYLEPAAELREVERGRLRLQLGDGSYTLRLWLRSPGAGAGREFELGGFAPSAIDPTDAEVRVHLPDAIVQQGVSELRGK